jgi:hypothetical protein
VARKPNRKLIIGATGLMALGGATGAIAATQSPTTSRKAFVDDVAKRLNVSPDAVSAAMKAAMTDRIDAEVTAGKLTSAQAAALKQRVQQTGGVPFVGGGAFRRGGLGGRLAVAAQYLGLSDQALHSQLASGKSLAQVAGATPGKSVDGLRAALLAHAKTRLDKAVAMGWLTPAQQQQRLTKLGPKIDALITRAGLP